MAPRSYADFDLIVERRDAGYRAKVVTSPAGRATADFMLPFQDLEIENFLLRVGRRRSTARRINSPEMAAAKAFGGKLYEAVFAGDVKACLRSSLDDCDEHTRGLRLRLNLDGAPELADLPWEFLYDSGLNSFLSLSADTPLVRYLDIPARIRPIPVTPPLVILVMIASPSDYAQLDVEREWAQLNAALDPLIRAGKVRLQRVTDGAQPGNLQRTLRTEGHHVLHFIGHGGFDQASESGMLVFEDERGHSQLVSGEHLGTILHDHRATLRLVVLNACEGARSSRSDPFAGTAQTLVQQGLPAVMAMQFEISDQAAITLAREFYSAIADGYPVDAALAEARKSIYQANDTEWATPVLYLRAPDGCIFDIGAPSAAPAVVVVPPPAPAPRPVEPSRPATPVPVEPAPAPRASEPTGDGSMEAYRLYLRKCAGRFRAAHRRGYWLLGGTIFFMLMTWSLAASPEAEAGAGAGFAGILMLGYLASFALLKRKSFSELIAKEKLPPSVLDQLVKEPEFQDITARRYLASVFPSSLFDGWLYTAPLYRIGFVITIVNLFIVVGIGDQTNHQRVAVPAPTSYEGPVEAAPANAYNQMKK